jgi:hypothetical protein
MKRNIQILALLSVCALSQAQFISNGLAVSVIGDGSGALSSAASQTRIFAFDKSTAAQSGQFVVGFNGGATGDRLTNSGTATSEGHLLNSVDGQGLTIMGYDAAVGTASVAGTTSANVNRVVGLVGFDSTITYTKYTNAFSANNPRSAVTVDGSEYWMAGAGTVGGIVYGPGSGGTVTQVSTGLTNTRVVGIFGGDIYFTSQSGSFVGMNKISGLPNTGSTPVNLFTQTGMSPYGFFIKDDRTIYVADDRNNVNGGIQKWTFDGSGWSLAYTLGTGVTNIGARGLAGEIDGNGNAVLYAITSETSANRLITITDTGSSATALTLSTAAQNTIYRGVAFTPVPEPATMLALGAGLAALVARRKRK